MLLPLALVVLKPRIKQIDLRGNVKLKPSTLINPPYSYFSLFCVVLAAHAQCECDIGRNTSRTINKDKCIDRSVASLVFDQVDLLEKHWQALASGLCDCGARVTQVNKHWIKCHLET